MSRREGEKLAWDACTVLAVSMVEQACTFQVRVTLMHVESSRAAGTLRRRCHGTEIDPSQHFHKILLFRIHTLTMSLHDPLLRIQLAWRGSGIQAFCVARSLGCVHIQQQGQA